MRPVDPPVVVPHGVPGRTKAERVQAMFARLVAGYDRMNRVMTLGLDLGWRRAAARALEPRGRTVLDLGTGTGDLALALARLGPRRVVGVDFVEGMLGVAREKCRRAGVGPRVDLVVGDALHLPFPDASFDALVNGFLLRNVADLPACFGEMARVLTPGGRLVCLELTHPPRLIAPFFRAYFGRVVPFLGALLTGEADAYRYLPASLAPLPEPARLARLLEAAGFVDVRCRRLSLGVVAIHTATRGRHPLAPGGASS